ncbi:MAG: translation initiation factor IF-2, partial [Psychromonas sp.]
MSDMSLKDLAKDLNKSEEVLVKQFADAGIKKTASDKVSLTEKQTLTSFLQKQHGGESKTKMTLQRKTKSTLNVKGSTGQAKAVQVEVRKKRTYVKRSDSENQETQAAELADQQAENAKLQAEIEAKKLLVEQAQAAKLVAKKEADEKAKKAAAANKEKQTAVKSE